LVAGAERPVHEACQEQGHQYLRLEQVRNTDHCGQREPQVERPDSERKAAVFFTVSGGTV